MSQPSSTRIDRAKHIYQKQGFRYLIKQGFSFLINLVLQYRIPYRHVYLKKEYHVAMDGINEIDPLPNVQDYITKAISTNKEADELAANGFEDFRQNKHVRRAGEKLDKGAIAFCVFIGKEFANFNWIATTEEARDALTDIPFQVDFSKGEVFIENIFTVPKYRKRGLNVYNRYKRQKYLEQKGATTIRYMSPNPPRPQRPNKPILGVTYGKGCYIRILWWKYWKVTSIAPTNQDNTSL